MGAAEQGGRRARPAGRRCLTNRRRQLWGGRFTSGPSDALVALSRSTHFDWRLAPYDLTASRAHARVLHRAGLLDDDQLAGLLAALDTLADDVASGAFGPLPADEDVHTALERGLVERAGADLGGRLRAGRSRNDQIATLIRMYAREHARAISRARARPGRRAGRPGRGAPRACRCPDARTCSTPSPCCWPTTCSRTPGRCCATSTGCATGTVARPARRTAQVRWPGRRSGSTRRRWPRTSVSTGRSRTRSTARPRATSWPSSCSSLAMIGIDLSRLAEEVVIWATREFGFVELDDAYSTGSSIMPQKKNPDVAELARGKAGRLVGDLTGLLTTLKGLPLAYNRDLQEDKEPLFDAVDTLEVLLPAVTGHDRDAAVPDGADGRAGRAGVRAGHRRRGVAGPAGRAVQPGPRDRRRVRAGVRGARDRAGRADRR